MTANSNSFPRPYRILVDENKNITVMKQKDSYYDIFSLKEEELE
jgi:hypothetical protein